MTQRDPRVEQLQERIDELEEENRRLRERLGKSDEFAEPTVHPSENHGEDPPAAWKQIEWWVERIGVALLLLGLALMVYLTVDRQWLSPLAAVATGLVKRPSFRRGDRYIYPLLLGDGRGLGNPIFLPHPGPLEFSDLAHPGPSGRQPPGHQSQNIMTYPLLST